MIKKLFGLITPFLLVLSIATMEIEQSDQQKKKAEAAYAKLCQTLDYDPQVVVFSNEERYMHKKSSFGLENTAGTQYMTGFHHGICGHGSNAFRFAETGIFDTGYTFNFPDSNGNRDINLTKACIGQHNDAQVASKVAKYIEKLYKPQKINFYGISRGGAVVLHLLGNMKEKKFQYLNEKIRQKLGCVILDAPLGCIKDVVTYKRQQIINQIITFCTSPFSTLVGIGSLFSGAYNLLPQSSRNIVESSTNFSANALDSLINHCILPLIFREYNPNSIDPKECVQNIDPNLPMILFSSKEDTLIPPNSIEEIAEIRTTNSHSSTYMRQLPHGSHHKALLEHQLYLVPAVHAFYKEHQCGTFNEWQAQQGIEKLKCFNQLTSLLQNCDDD